jgi:uncharacterized protein (TIGR02266 family)
MSDHQPSNPPERRSFPRIAMEVDIGMFSESNFYAGLTQDISEGGLFVATHTPFAVGTTVSVRFTLPAVREIQAEGIVVWVREPLAGNSGMGIQFKQLSPEDAATIQRFIAKRPPLYHEEEL